MVNVIGTIKSIVKKKLRNIMLSMAGNWLYTPNICNFDSITKC